MTLPGRSPKHGNPGILEGYHPLALGKLALPALAHRLASAGTRPLVAASAVTTVRGYDDVTVSAEPSDGQWYGFYFDGPYANGTAVKAAFPSRDYVSISGYGTNGARCIDIEPGLAVNSQAVGFFRNPDHDGGKPMFYTSAGNLASLELTLRGGGIPRSAVDLWSAHYTNSPHFCAPWTCGYGLSQSDACQWATGSYDSDIALSSVFAPPVVLPPVKVTTYPAPTKLSVVGGRTSFSAVWGAPEHPGLPAPDHYVVEVYDGVADRTHLVSSYPRDQKATQVSPPDGSLLPGHHYILHVFAVGPDGKYVHPFVFASAEFITG